MDITFLPLELWRASSLAQETKTVIAAYERCLASGDAEGLAALRAAIDQRIDDLESFYIAHVDDERSILFEKQRLKLRKLVHEYDTMSYAPSGAAAPGTRGSAPLETRTSSYGDAPEAAVRSARGADMEGMVTREIRDDTRLQLHELMAWFLQAGVAEMPEVTPEVVERVFVSVTRTNTDGCMSVRDLRQWYITFGRRALREGLPMDSIVSTDFVRVATAAAVSARRPDFDPSATSSGLPFAATSSSYTPRKPLYAWEGGASVSGPGTLQLPNGILEFQVRLTPEEYSQLMLRRRMLDAEAKYKQRIAAAKERGASGSGALLASTTSSKVDTSAVPATAPAAGYNFGTTSLITTGPYEEPASKNTYFYRSP